MSTFLKFLKYVIRDKIICGWALATFTSSVLVFYRSDSYLLFFGWAVSETFWAVLAFILWRRGRRYSHEFKQDKENFDHWTKEVLDAGASIAAAVAHSDMYGAQQHLPRYQEAINRMILECDMTKKKWTARIP